MNDFAYTQEVHITQAYLFFCSMMLLGVHLLLLVHCLGEDTVLCQQFMLENSSDVRPCSQS